MTVSLRIGLLRLADSVTVLMARDWGLFAEAGIDAAIMVEPSWANIADGLSWSGLDAAVVFPPLAIMTALGKRGRPTPMNVVANLSNGGNTIVLRDRACLDKEAPRFAVVHSYSTHFLLLRRYLAQRCPHALDHLVIMPPDTMLDALRAATIDGFCAGPPWGKAAERAGLGHVVAGSATIWPRHPEKQFVLTDAWSWRHPVHAARLADVLTQATERCLDPAARGAMMDVLTRSLATGGLDLPPDAVRAVLPGSDDPDAFGLGPAPGTSMAPLLADMRALGWIDPADELRSWASS